jgi:hypothetical protein
MTQLQTGKYQLPWQQSVPKCNANEILSKEWFSYCGWRPDASYLDNLISDINNMEHSRAVINVTRFQKVHELRLKSKDIPLTGRGGP